MSGYKVIVSAAKQIRAMQQGIDLLVESYFDDGASDYIICTHCDRALRKQKIGITVFKSGELDNKDCIEFELSNKGLELVTVGDYSTVDLYILGVAG